MSLKKILASIVIAPLIGCAAPQEEAREYRDLTKDEKVLVREAIERAERYMPCAEGFARAADQDKVFGYDGQEGADTYIAHAKEALDYLWEFYEADRIKATEEPGIDGSHDRDRRLILVHKNALQEYPNFMDFEVLVHEGSHENYSKGEGGHKDKVKDARDVHFAEHNATLDRWSDGEDVDVISSEVIGTSLTEIIIQTKDFPYLNGSVIFEPGFALAYYDRGSSYSDVSQEIDILLAQGYSEQDACDQALATLQHPFPQDEWAYLTVTSTEPGEAWAQWYSGETNFEKLAKGLLTIGVDRHEAIEVLSDESCPVYEFAHTFMVESLKHDSIPYNYNCEF